MSTRWRKIVAFLPRLAPRAAQPFEVSAPHATRIALTLSEGCSYGGEWTSMDRVRVHRERDRKSSLAFDLTAGEKVTAVTGAVVVLRAGRVEFMAATRLSSDDGMFRVSPGDTCTSWRTP